MTESIAIGWNDTATSTGPNGEPEGTIDVLLCPTAPSAALPLEHSKYWGYTSQWNLLDYPSAAFPVTKVIPEVDLVEQDFVPRNWKDEYNHELCEPADDPYSDQNLLTSLKTKIPRFTEAFLFRYN